MKRKWETSVTHSEPPGASVRTLAKKVCLLGDFGVGKTSLVERFIYGRFNPLYQASIGVQTRGKVVMLDDLPQPTEVKMVIWDIAGSQRLSDNPMRESYLRGSHGALLVCDLTRRETVDALRGYMEDLARVKVDMAVVLAANKADLEAEREVRVEELAELATAMDAKYLLTSAKDGRNVEAAFRTLAEMMAAVS
jgi:small GTP-binding protein